MSENIFELQGVSFSYKKGNEILHGVDLKIPKGKVTAVIGPNGCGKTTTFCLLSKVYKNYGGRIFFNGSDISDYKIKQYAKSVAVVHQYNVVPEDITVKKLVAMGRTPYHSAIFSSETEDDRKAINEALNFTKITEFADKKVSELSGGQMQRVWLALAIAQSKEVLLLDEITTYLDIYYQFEILQLIRKLNSEYNTTVVLVLHDINQTMRFSDYTAMMKNGEITSFGETKDVITSESIRQTYGVNAEIINDESGRYCLFK